MNSIIETKDLCKTFTMGSQELNILNNVNLTIDRGEFVSIMGPSGSGKSTLLYLLGGLDAQHLVQLPLMVKRYPTSMTKKKVNYVEKT